MVWSGELTSLSARWPFTPSSPKEAKCTLAWAGPQWERLSLSGFTRADGCGDNLFSTTGRGLREPSRRVRTQRSAYTRS
jgi:hypothetical protein